MTVGAGAMVWLRDAQKRRVRVRTIAEVDAYFLEAERQFAVSNDAGMRALDRLRLVPPRRRPLDPFSRAYNDAQWELYLQISGRTSYDASTCEKTPFDVDAALRRPFPYSSGNLRLVSDQLLGQGYLLQQLAPDARQRVVEFGAGWGNLTLAMASAGADVTVVEIDAGFAELLARRAAQAGVKVAIERTDMMAFVPKAPFDVVIFYESFHHCHDHQMLAERLRSFLAPGGRVVFASEPVTVFPYAWGPRLDGQSLWAMRMHGWLELGFDRAYFRRLLAKAGFRLEHRRSRVAHIADVWIATPS